MRFTDVELEALVRAELRRYRVDVSRYDLLRVERDTVADAVVILNGASDEVAHLEQRVSRTDAGRAYALESLPPAPKPKKLTRYADFRRVGECYEDFASYLGIQFPAYEERGQPWLHSAGYRMYRGSKWSEWGRDVQGEWAPTNKEAKASYKAVLQQRRATGCFSSAELAVSMSFASPPCAGFAKLLPSRSWMGAMRNNQRRPADLGARRNRQWRDEVNQNQAGEKPSLVAIAALPIAPITLVATAVPSAPPLVIPVMVPAIASAVVSAAAVPIVRSDNTAAQQRSGSN